MKRVAFAWCVTTLGLVSPTLPAQDSDATEAPTPPVSKAEWKRLQTLTSKLVSEEATLKLYQESPGLGDSFGSNESFSDLVSKWRQKISPLMDTWSDSPNVEVKVNRKEDGTDVFFLTFYHEKPANSMTILKTVWSSNNLLKISFLKGFANVPYDNASRVRYLNKQEDDMRRWRDYYQPSPRPNK